MARKQVQRSLPADWPVEITFASNGLEGLAAIRAGKGEMTLLDLTMPELDGFGVMEAIRKEDLSAMVIVISGDIQPQARERVLALGALDFIQKPISPDKLRSTLQKFGLL
jgi:CheY-like chemotaxis protein